MYSDKVIKPALATRMFFAKHKLDIHEISKIGRHILLDSRSYFRDGFNLLAINNVSVPAINQLFGFSPSHVAALSKVFSNKYLECVIGNVLGKSNK